jgi:hypothetical protein
MAAAALALGSAAASESSNRDVADRQKRIIEAMRQYQVGKATQGRKAISDYLDTITPEARIAGKNAATSELEQGLNQSVDAVKSYETPSNFSGKVSDSYKNRLTSDTAATADRIGRAMKQLAVIGTPAEQQQSQGIRFGRAATDVDAANSAIRGVSPAYMGAISRVRPNPWDSFFAQGLGGASNAFAGGGRRRPTTLGYDPRNDW